MNKKTVIALVIALAMMLGISLSSCAKQPDTLESFLNSNQSVMEEIQSTADSAQMDVKVSGNTVTLTYDLANVAGATEETVKDPVMIETLETSLDGMSSTLVESCKELESRSGISGIQMEVNFTFGDEVLVSKTYTSAG